MEMGSSFSEQKLITLMTSSLLNLHHPALQTLTAVDRAAKLKLSNTSLTAPPQTITATLAGMSSHELMDYFIEEAKHQLIEDDQAKQTESAMHAQSKKKNTRRNKGKLDKHCKNCDKSGHIKDDCWSPGGRKEGQGPKQTKKGSKEQKKDQLAVKATTGKTFTFTCTSTFVGVANSL